MIPQAELEVVIDHMDQLFAGRRDGYGRYVPESKTKSDLTVKRALTRQVWTQHLRGTMPIGVFPILPGDPPGSPCHAAWGCFDVDHALDVEQVQTATRSILPAAKSLGFELVVEASRGKGYHLWLFLDSPVETWKMVAVMKLILGTAGLKEFQKGAGCELKIFPKQADLSKLQWGNYVYVPLFGGAHPERCKFLDPETFRPIEDQYAYLAWLLDRRHPAGNLEALIADRELAPDNIVPLPGSAPTKKPPVPSGIKPGDMFDRSEAGAGDPLTDAELLMLCGLLPALRKVRKKDPGLSYNQWLAALIHLVPFRDGLVRARELEMGELLAGVASGRYRADQLEEKWREACKIYDKPSRAGNASLSERLVVSLRQGGRDDVVPISHKHGIWNGGFCVRSWEEMAPSVWIERAPTQIANFVLKVDAHETIQVPDGAPEKRIRVSGRLASGEELRSMEIEGHEWKKIAIWLHRLYGCAPIIYSGRANGDYVLECIALSSTDAEHRCIHTTTGWIKDSEGKHLFLLGDGAHGGVPTEETRVEVTPQLRGYSLSREPSEDQVRHSYEWMENFIHVAPAEITGSLLSVLFLAPLMSWLPIDFGLFLSGETQSRKSSLVAVLLSWMGQFEKGTLPVNLSATMAGALQVMHAAKDLPLVMDNFIPGLDSNSLLMQIARAMGDRAGRTRSDRGIRLRAIQPPRCMPLVTGEDFVSGPSSEVRFFHLRLSRSGPGSVDNARLLDMQEVARRDILRPGMAHYLTWLAKNLELPEFLPSLVERYHQITAHMRKAIDGRPAEQIAWITLGLEIGGYSHPDGKWCGPEVEEAIIALNNSTILIESQAKTKGLASRVLGAMFGMMGAGGLIAHDRSTGMKPDVAWELFGWKPDGNRLDDRAVRGAVCTLQSREQPGNWWIILRMDSLIPILNRWLPERAKIADSPMAISLAFDNEQLCVRRQGHRITAVEWVDGIRCYGIRLKGPAVMDFMGLSSARPPSPEKENPPPAGEG